METNKTKMWSYRLVWDTMFAPNPLWGVLTLATCKPTIRKSKKTVEGMWLAGWTACTLHNSPIENNRVQRIERGKEELIYLARVSKIVSLDDYWELYPHKRCNPNVSITDASYYGDNIYNPNHKVNGYVEPMDNHGDHKGYDAARRDYYNGKRVLICEEYFYFTPEKRIKDIPPKFKVLVHAGRGQSLKDGQIVEEFIDFVREQAEIEGVKNGIVGDLPIEYVDTGNSALAVSEDIEPHIYVSPKRKRDCSK